MCTDLASDRYESTNSPYINRFLQPDSIIPDLSNPQSWNRYSYVTNRPVIATDPTGHVVKNEIQQGDGDCFSHIACVQMWHKNENRKFEKFKNNQPFREPCDEGGPRPICSQNSDPRLDQPLDYTFGNSLANTSSLSSSTDELVQTLDFGLEGMNLLDLVEDGIQWGRPAYRQVKYAVPLGGWEYLADGLLQVYDDRNKDLTFGQHFVRGLIRAGESAFTDGASTLVGGTAAAALQASVPIPFVPAGVGYVVGSYTTSTIFDSFFVNNVNPYLFDRFLGGS